MLLVLTLFVIAAIYFTFFMMMTLHAFRENPDDLQWPLLIVITGGIGSFYYFKKHYLPEWRELHSEENITGIEADKKLKNRPAVGTVIGPDTSVEDASQKLGAGDTIEPRKEAGTE